MESHLRDGVSLSVSHITSAGNWNATERIATDFPSEHWRVLVAAVDHGYYERSQELSIADLASILDEPRSTVQYRLRTAEDRIVSQFVEQTRQREPPKEGGSIWIETTGLNCCCLADIQRFGG
jgi:predicted DNA binding protein